MNRLSIVILLLGAFASMVAAACKSLLHQFIVAYPLGLTASLSGADILQMHLLYQ